MSEEKSKKKYRVIVIHSPIQFILKTDKEGKEFQKEVSENVLKTKAYPQDVIVAEVKEAEEKSTGAVINKKDLD